MFKGITLTSSGGVGPNITYGRAKLLKWLIVDSAMPRPRDGAISGSVMWRKIRNGVAPSILAASGTSAGIVCSAARAIKYMKGHETQKAGSTSARSERR